MLRSISMSKGSSGVELRYTVDTVREDWTLPEEPVPESRPHDLVCDLLKCLLAAWIARTGRNAKVGRNLAVHWNKDHPQVGMAPDIYVVEPSPPEDDELSSLRLWEKGHHALLLAIEIVSANRPEKDYVSAPERNAAGGTHELWIFDPKLSGSKSYGGPMRLQIWRRGEDDRFVRIYAGDGPAYSPLLNAWLFVVNEGRFLRIADDREGNIWWMTGEEAERAAKEAERSEKLAALKRIAELEAALNSKARD